MAGSSLGRHWNSLADVSDPTVAISATLPSIGDLVLFWCCLVIVFDGICCIDVSIKKKKICLLTSQRNEKEKHEPERYDYHCVFHRQSLPEVTQEEAGQLASSSSYSSFSIFFLSFFLSFLSLLLFCLFCLVLVSKETWIRSNLFGIP